MNSPGRELELKFIVGPRDANILADVLSAGEPPSVRALASIYFDTASHSLWRAGYTLRLRKDGRRWTQTIKSRSGLDGGLARGEWETPARRGAPDLAAARRTPLAGVLPRRGRLAPLFRVTVERTSWRVVEPDGVIEVSLDRGAAEAKGRRVPILEVELELKSGDPGALFALARRLGQAVPLRLSFTTKADRGMALSVRTGEAARHFRAPELRGEMTAGAAFRAIARASVAQIAGNAEALSSGGGEEAVHQMRVGARRLRGALSIFKAMLAEDRVDGIDAELRWLTGEFDAVRDLDVFLAGAFARIPPDEADRATLGRRLRRARAAALARARAAVASERFASLLIDGLIWIEAGPWTLPGAAGSARRDSPVADFAAGRLEKGRRKVERRGRGLKTMDRKERHRLRIRAKTLRYGADAFVGLFGHPHRAERFRDALKGFVECLGDLNDIAAGEAIAAEFALPESLIAAETAREDELVDAARRAFAGFRRARPFWSCKT